VNRGDHSEVGCQVYGENTFHGDVMKTKRQLLNLLFSCMMMTGFVAWYALGSTATYTYDAAGRLILTSYGSNTNISYSYDAAGNLLIESGPAPGIILAAVSGKQLTFWWSATPAGFVLQTSPALGSAADWQNVTTPNPVQSGNYLSVTVTAGPENTFYRLSH
jgi:YD repeat-containing protein